MDGRQILGAIVSERLEELNQAAPEVQAQIAPMTFNFCNGAGEALLKAGLISISDKAAVMDRLIDELEARELGQRVSVTMRETRSATFIRPADGDV